MRGGTYLPEDREDIIRGQVRLASLQTEGQEVDTQLIFVSLDDITTRVLD